MKNRQTRLVIATLVGLVLFTSSLAFLFYSKQGETKIATDENVEVYVASRDITRGEHIAAKDLKKEMLPKSYISGVALTDAEIIGRYAAVSIFEKEPFRKEKLQLNEPEDETKKREEPKELALKETMQEQNVQITQDAVTDTITLPLSLFQNIDTRLKAGDYIDIVSVVPKETGRRVSEFSTKYIALNIRIYSFVHNANVSNKLAIKGIKNETSLANAVVLEMSPTEIKNFFAIYYKTQELNAKRVFNATNTSKGHLWMVKCSVEENQSTQKLKDKLMLDRVVAKKRVKRVEKVSISYEK